MRQQPLVNMPMFIGGLGMALTAAGLLFFDAIDAGPAAVIGIIGISLIATSRVRR
jgi:hypothetical protein